jgi:hypothetical protein
MRSNSGHIITVIVIIAMITLKASTYNAVIPIQSSFSSVLCHFHLAEPSW